MNITIASLGRADGYVIPLFDNQKTEIKKLTKKTFSASFGELLLIPAKPSSAHEFNVLLGLGKTSKMTAERVRRVGSILYKKAKAEKWQSLAVNADSLYLGADAYSIQALVEGLILSDYKFDKYQSKKKSAKSKAGLSRVTLQLKGARKQSLAKKALNQGRIMADAVNLARTFGNEPANVLYPDSYAKRIQAECRGAKIKSQVLDPKKMERLKMGGILGVGMGSARPPRLVIMEYKPTRRKNSKPIVLVGKGITFDTGGISIKPAKGMEEMKFDMCGSAAVVGAVTAAARLKLPIHVIGLTPLAENMPGSRAQRPGDVIRCMNGKTVEVFNTDAEGRLVLADALAYAERFKPECVVDIATLTGACAYVLDYAGSGVMTNNSTVVKKLIKAGDNAGERLLEFPLWDEYNEFIKGSVGDIRNISRKAAGIQTAGAFLQHFGDHSPWAHVDIAGTAWGAPRVYNPEGATGVGVRLFVEFLKSYL